MADESTVLVVFFSLYMSKIQVPIPTCRNGKEKTYLPIFQLLPILLALIVMWILCAVLTATNVFPDNPDHSLYFSRTDAKISIVQQSPWFQFTYPAQFGFPSFSVAASIGFFAAVMASLLGAAMATLPPPILGGILLVVLGLLAALGLSTLKYADMTCNRNLLVVGVAFMSGLTVPSFVDQHGDMISTGTDEERGLVTWRQSHAVPDIDVSEEADPDRKSSDARAQSETAT
nr:hypothetical protein BaRGS_018530 [Batillaria attramentaria]